MMFITKTARVCGAGRFYGVNTGCVVRPMKLQPENSIPSTPTSTTQCRLGNRGGICIWDIMSLGGLVQRQQALPDRVSYTIRRPNQGISPPAKGQYRPRLQPPSGVPCHHIFRPIRLSIWDAYNWI